MIGALGGFEEHVGEGEADGEDDRSDDDPEHAKDLEAAQDGEEDDQFVQIGRAHV